MEIKTLIFLFTAVGFIKPKTPPILVLILDKLIAHEHQGYPSACKSLYARLKYSVLHLSYCTLVVPRSIMNIVDIVSRRKTPPTGGRSGCED